MGDRERFLCEYLSGLDLERDLNARGGVRPLCLGGVLELPFRAGDCDGDLCESLPVAREYSRCTTEDLDEERELLSPGFEDLCIKEQGDFPLISGDAMRLIGGGSGTLTLFVFVKQSGDGGSFEELLSLEESELLSSEEESELLCFDEARDLRLLFVQGEDDFLLKPSGCSCLVGSMFSSSALEGL